jgi:hypothetical protein
VAKQKKQSGRAAGRPAPSIRVSWKCGTSNRCRSRLLGSLRSQNVHPTLANIMRTWFAAVLRQYGPRLWAYLIKGVRNRPRERALLLRPDVRRYVCYRLCDAVLAALIETCKFWPAAAGSPGGLESVLHPVQAGLLRRAIALEKLQGWPSTTCSPLVVVGARLLNALVCAVGPSAVNDLVRTAGRWHAAIAATDPRYAKFLVEKCDAAWFANPAVHQAIRGVMSKSCWARFMVKVAAPNLPSRVRAAAAAQGNARALPPSVANPVYQGKGAPPAVREIFLILQYLAPGRQRVPGGPKYISNLYHLLKGHRGGAGPSQGLEVAVDTTKKRVQRLRQKVGWIEIPPVLRGTRILELLAGLDPYGP